MTQLNQPFLHLFIAFTLISWKTNSEKYYNHSQLNKPVLTIGEFYCWQMPVLHAGKCLAGGKKHKFKMAESAVRKK